MEGVKNLVFLVKYYDQRNPDTQRLKKISVTPRVVGPHLMFERVKYRVLLIRALGTGMTIYIYKRKGGWKEVLYEHLS